MASSRKSDREDHSKRRRGPSPSKSPDGSSQLSYDELLKEFMELQGEYQEMYVQNGKLERECEELRAEKKLNKLEIAALLARLRTQTEEQLKVIQAYKAASLAHSQLPISSNSLLFQQQLPQSQQQQQKQQQNIPLLSSSSFVLMRPPPPPPPPRGGVAAASSVPSRVVAPQSKSTGK